MEKQSVHRSRLGRGSAVLGFVAWSLSSVATAWGECPIPLAEFEPDPAATSSFLEKRCKFDTVGTNPFLILLPGYKIVLESDEEMQVITVLERTHRVAGVKTRVVQEDSFEKDGDELILIERSFNYYAICRQTNSVFYFGEDVEFFDEDGNVIGTEGAWLVGRNGAKPGIVMPGTLLVGGAYYEEIAPADSALDKGRILSIEKGCEAGEMEFDGLCVAIAGFNDCNDDEDEKLYAKGIGIVVDDDLEISDFGFDDEDDENDCDERGNGRGRH